MCILCYLYFSYTHDFAKNKKIYIQQKKTQEGENIRGNEKQEESSRKNKVIAGYEIILLGNRDSG